MKKFIEFVSTTKNMIIIFSAICFVFIGISFFTDALTKPLRSAISVVITPMQKGLNYIGLWTSEKITTMQDIEDLLVENDGLKEQVGNLTAEVNQLKQMTYEVDRLKKLFEMSETISYPTTGANVIGKGTDNWFATFTIDKGSEDGIDVDMNVIAEGGLVGIVTSVTPHTAEVTSIINDNSNVSGMLIDTGDICTVSGDLRLMDSKLIKLSKFKKDVVLRDGDKIVTSNISNKYLEGILIGYAQGVQLDANALTQSGYLVPAVDFEHLREVLIILEKKQQ